MPPTFLQRYGYAEPDAEITVREGDPAGLRGVLVDFAYDAGLLPSQLRTTVCGVLMVRPDLGNWSEFPNIDQEVRLEMEGLEDDKWFYLYEIIQRVAEKLRGDSLDDFADRVNEFFRRHGYGWQLVNGVIEIRGPETFEEPVRVALGALDESDRWTAHTELQEALRDISRRPEPDTTGAIQHSMAALECLGRDISAGKETLGALIRKHPGLFPKPLDEVVHKLWGYASNEARHPQAGSRVEFGDAQLVVHIASALCGYLMQRFDDENLGASPGDIDELPFE